MKIGQTVKDIVTGLQGVAIGHAEFLDRSEALLVQPPVKADGSLPDSQWIDVLRLRLVDGVEEIAVKMDPAHRRFQFVKRAREEEPVRE